MLTFFFFKEVDDRNSTHLSPELVHARKLNFLINSQRESAYAILKEHSSNGRLNTGVASRMASSLCVSERTIRLILKQAENTGDSLHKKINCGRKKLQIDLDKIRDIPLNQRSTLRSLAYSLNMNLSTLFKFLKKGKY